MRQRIRVWIILGCVFAMVCYTGYIFLANQSQDMVLEGPGVVRTGMLSDYEPGLKGTFNDTPVYFLDSGVPGATMLIVGGVHPDEPASHLAAALILENAVMQEGRCIVIPWANRSGFSYNLPMEAHPARYAVATASGMDRLFKFGARLTNPAHQWPDPSVYVDPVSKQQLAGSEARNLNRAYPGNPRGTLTQKTAHAIVTLIRWEQVDVAIDMHESSPEYPVINTIVAHDRAMQVAVVAAMNLQSNGLDLGVEASPAGLRGLSHREWGDHTETLAFLIETPNPSQGRLRGKTDQRLIVTGQDPMYLRLGPTGRLYVEFTPKGYPLEDRVGRQLQAILEIVDAYNFFYPETPLGIAEVPGYEALVRNGLKNYLEPTDNRR